MDKEILLICLGAVFVLAIILILIFLIILWWRNRAAEAEPQNEAQNGDGKARPQTGVQNNHNNNNFQCFASLLWKNR